MTPLQFTLTTPLKNLDFIFNYLHDNKNRYSIQKILVAGEDNPKEHFHVVVVYGQDLEQSWLHQNAIVKYLVDKLNLRKNQNGGQVLYTNGKKKGTINDLEKTLSYCLKQKLGIQFYGFTEEEIQKGLDSSFEKDPQTKLDYMNKLKEDALEYFEENFNEGMTIYRSHFSCYDKKNEHYMTPIRPNSPDSYGGVYYSPRDLTHKVKKFIYYFIRNNTETNLKSITTIKSVAFYVVNKTKKIEDDIRFEILENI